MRNGYPPTLTALQPGPFGAPREIAGGAEAVFYLIFEVDGEQKPACVADLVFRYYVSCSSARPTISPHLADADLAARFRVFRAIPPRRRS